MLENETINKVNVLLNSNIEMNESCMAVIIDDYLKEKLLSLEEKDIYTYVIHEDEITMRLYDFIEMDDSWSDILLMIIHKCKIDLFKGIILSNNFYENGCFAILFEPKDIKEIIRKVQSIDKDIFSKMYLDYKENMSFEFEQDWESFREIYKFFDSAKDMNKNILVFS